MEFRIFDGGRRVIGFQRTAVTDRIELDGPSEAVEPETGPEPLVFERCEEPTVWIEDRTPATAERLVDRVRRIWLECRATSREYKISVAELLKLVKLCDDENRRHGKANKRLEVRAADLVE